MNSPLLSGSARTGRQSVPYQAESFSENASSQTSRFFNCEYATECGRDLVLVQCELINSSKLPRHSSPRFRVKFIRA